LYHPSPAQAQAYAAGAAAQYGWTGQNWTDLVKLWTRESSWLWYAENASSGAYGIPQSLPGSKMAAFGANWRDDAAVQIDWGLSYIAQRYGSPSKAWEHSEQVGWY
ncbi:aggregation-promoting factor C-terminal-like domain-containing protein, partial [Bifidobacterium pseudocatenulatum]|nr:G5 domain-containing protein [Bifidobacterium pseudocatenulatum]